MGQIGRQSVREVHHRADARHRGQRPAQFYSRDRLQVALNQTLFAGALQIFAAPLPSFLKQRQSRGTVSQSSADTYQIARPGPLRLTEEPASQVPIMVTLTVNKALERQVSPPSNCTP